jgi:predicted transcriptional regulator
LRWLPNPAYDKAMAKAKKFELESSAPILGGEDEETLAAIDEGIRDAKAGRTVPAEEVRKRLPKWITASSTRKGR